MVVIFRKGWWTVVDERSRGETGTIGIGARAGSFYMRQTFIIFIIYRKKKPSA